MSIQDYDYSKHIKQINNVNFTQREIDILSCILHHRGSKKIAEFLSISPKTVETHTRNIMLKLSCHGRERIIDFLEESEELANLKKRYTYLRINSLFEGQLHHIGRVLNPLKRLCYCHYDAEDKGQVSFFRTLKKHLEMSRIVVEDYSDKNLIALHKIQEQDASAFYIYGAFDSLPQGLQEIKKDEVQEENPSWSQQLFIASPSLPMPNAKQTEQSDCQKLPVVISLEKETYYHVVFLLISHIAPEVEIQKYRAALETNIKKELEPPQWAPLKNSNILMPSSFFSKMQNTITTKNTASVAIILCLIFLLLPFGNISIFNAHSLQTVPDTASFIRSDLLIPNDTLLLPRKQFFSQMDKKFQGAQGIKTLALVGIGGAGKTTLARYYSRKQKEKIIWEINAETPETLLDSFKFFAYALCQTQKEKDELNHIGRIQNSLEHKRQLLYFIKSKLKARNNWLLIYENVGKFSDIQPYFPSDENTWGQGRIIILTQNSNIKNNNYIGENNIISILPLTYKEKYQLFMKITQLNNISYETTEKASLKKFIEKLPPFPLDISVAAYYLKSSGISPQQYLQHLKKSHKTFSTAQKRLLEDVSDYTKTRYGILTLSLQKIIKAHPDFKELLFLISAIESQNIPISLLKIHKTDLILDSFLHHLRKYSLITFNNSAEGYFSIHRSTQKISLDYLDKNLNFAKDSSTLNAISETFEKYMSEISKDSNENEMSAILPHVEKFRVHTTLLNQKNKGALLFQLGKIHYYLGHYQKAQMHLSQANILYTKEYGKNHPQLVPILSCIGKIYRNFGDHIKARELLEEGLLIYNKHHQPDDLLNIAWISTHLGNVYRNLGFLPQAETYLKDSIAIYKKYYGDEHRNVAWASIHLANVYRNLKKYDRAHDLLKKSYLIFSKKHGENHMLTVWIRTCMGKIYKHFGHLEKAEKILKESLISYEQYFGIEHSQTAWVLRALGKVYLQKNDLEKAEHYLTRSFKILQQQNNTDRYRSLELLADIQNQKALKALKAGKPQKARDHKVQAQKMLVEVLQIVTEYFPHNSSHVSRLKNKVSLNTQKLGDI